MNKDDNKKDIKRTAKNNAIVNDDMAKELRIIHFILIHKYRIVHLRIQEGYKN